MKLAIYVPKMQADTWRTDTQSFGEFQSAVADIAGGLTVYAATGAWKGANGLQREPVFVVEVYADAATGPHVSGLFRQYAQQMLDNGEESVLIVTDNKPTLIQ